MKPRFFAKARSVTRLRVISLVAALAALAISSSETAAQVCTPVVPCGDPRGCPDLVVDPAILAKFLGIVTQTFASTDCSVVEGDVVAGTRKLLVFDTTTVNVGQGALVLGNPLDHPDWFDCQNCHNHCHLKDYAAFRLWTPQGYKTWKSLRAQNPAACADEVFAAHPELLSQLLSGKKHAFCLEDFDVALHRLSVPCPSVPDPPSFTCNYQGIGVCRADEYFVGLSGQWIDITGLPDGGYVLENEVNDEHFMTETDYTNNSAALHIDIRGKQVFFHDGA